MVIEVNDMKRLFLVATAILAVFALSACDSGYTNINNDELQEMLDNNPEYQFIDVRTSQEFYDVRIPGFSNIDYYYLDDDHSLTDHLDKDVPVVIMCNSGNRSRSAAAIFVEEGFTEVYNLTGGIQDWNGETE